MSTLVNFYADRDRRTPGKLDDKTKTSSAKPAPILPAAILLQLLHRRVTVLLSTRLEEIEGTLLKVDDERGDVFLDDCVHYQWERNDAKDGKGLQNIEEDRRRERPSSSSSSSSSSTRGETKKVGEGTPALWSSCRGGGSRREIRRSKAMMIQSRYIDVITPTLFGSSP